MYDKILEFIEKTKEKWENSVKFKLEAITVGGSFVAYMLGIIACILSIHSPLPIVAKMFTTLSDIFCGLGMGCIIWLIILEVFFIWIDHNRNN